MNLLLLILSAVSIIIADDGIPLDREACLLYCLRGKLYGCTGSAVEFASCACKNVGADVAHLQTIIDLISYCSSDHCNVELKDYRVSEEHSELFGYLRSL